MSYGFGIGTAVAEPTTQTKSGSYGFGIKETNETVPETAPSTPSTPFQSMVKTLSASIGGGAMNMVPGQPNTVVNTGHTTYAGEPAVAGQQRDDIVPVALGGVNENKANIRREPLLGKGQGTLTDPIEKQNIADYKAGKISLAEARLNVLTAKQKETGLSPSDASTIQPGGTGIFGRAIDNADKIITNLFGGLLKGNNTAAERAYPSISPSGLPFGSTNALGAGQGNNLEKGSVLRPGPTRLLAAKPKGELVSFSLNRNEQKISPNVQAYFTINNQLVQAQQDAAVTLKLAQERPADFNPLVAPLVAASLFLGPEFLDAPLATGVKLAIFQGLQTVEEKLNVHLSDIDPNADDKTKQFLDTVQMLGNGLLSHGIYESAPTIADAFTKDVIIQYNLPKQVYIPAETIKDIFQTGTKASQEQLDQFAVLTGGDRAKINRAIQNGLDVSVPAQKIVSLVDKPYWAAIKKSIGLEPSSPESEVVNLGEVKEAPKALLPAPETTAPSTPMRILHEQTNPLNNPLEGTDQGYGFNLKNEPTTAMQRLVEETQVAQVAEASKAAQRTIEAFNQSTNQVKIGENKGVSFELGSYGKKHFENKTEEGKQDRFPTEELPATIKNIQQGFRAADQSNVYRHDNIAWISKMPDGETRLIYTRQNKSGAEEILGWHKVAPENVERYTNDLQKNGAPDRSRTGILGLEVRKSNPLTYGGKENISQSEQNVNALTEEARKYANAEEFVKAQELPQILRGTKGLTADDIMKTYPNIKLTKDVPATDVYGNKVKIPEGEKLTPYELKGNKILLQDGQTYVVSKNQFENIKGQSVGGEAKPFAPELKGLEETVKGASKWQGNELIDNGDRLAEVYEGENGKWHYRSDFVEESPAFKTRKEAMENAEADALGIYSGNETKYSQYQLPGGKNYKEILIRASESKGNALDANNFKSSHWDEPDVISHLRLNERTYKGKNVSFMEELQSDWAREARKQGIAKDLTTENKTLKDYEQSLRDKYNYRRPTGLLSSGEFSIVTPAERAKWIELNDATRPSGIPDNPNLKSWQELSVKRALQEAVANKSGYFSWINGEQTSARYNLSIQVDNVKWVKGLKEGRKEIIIKGKQGEKFPNVFIDEKGVITSGGETTWKGKKLDEVLGKGLADKIMAKESGTLSGEGLKFGGEWANNLYDKQVKNIVEDLTGGKVEVIDLPLKEEYANIHYEGPTYSLDKLKEGLKISQGYKDIFVSPFTGEKSEFSFSRASVTQRLKDVIKAIEDGSSFKDAMSNVGSQELAGYFGGEQVVDPLKDVLSKQQAIKLTPEIKATIQGKGLKIKTSGEQFEDAKTKLTEIWNQAHETQKSSKINENVKPEKMTTKSETPVSEKLKEGTGETTTKGLPGFANPGAMIEDIRAQLEKIKQGNEDSKFGEALRSYQVGERDLRIAETNQLRDQLEKTLSPREQEALTFYRDYKGKSEQLAGLSNDPQFKPYKEVIDLAQYPTPAMLAADKKITDYFTGTLTEGKKLGFLDSTISNENYITHLLTPAEQAPGKKSGPFAGGKLGRRTPFAKARKFETVADAIKAGIKPKTLNALDALTIYGEKHAIAASTKLFLNQLKDSGIGKFGFKGSENIPNGWVPADPGNRFFRNTIPFIDKETGEPSVAYQDLYVPQKVADAIKPLVSTDFTGQIPGFRGIRLYQSYLKGIQLGLSIFHIKAMNITAFGNQGASGLIKSYANDMKSPAFLEAEKDFVKHGGTTSILGRTIEAYKGLRDTSIPSRMDLLKNVVPGIKQIDAFSKALTKLTFDIIQRKMKVTDYSLKVAQYLAKNPKVTEADLLQAKRSISKEVNAVYGGLNWDVMGWNRANLNIARFLLLAPDWTFSNFVNAKYAFKGGPAGSAARKFWIRSIIAGAVLSYLTSTLINKGKPPKPNFQNFTNVNMGKDKYGKEILQNLYFAGAPSDVVNLINNVADFGAIQGFAQSLAAKASPVIREAVQLYTNRNYLGQTVVPKGMGVVAGTGRSIYSAVTTLAPIPFSLSTLASMFLDPKKQYTLKEFITSLAGTRPRHVVPEGMREVTSGKKKGQLVPATPRTRKSTLEQIKTGQINQSLRKK